MTTDTPLLYLASSSPRRSVLLEQIGVNFQVVNFRTEERGGEPADIDETPLDGEIPAHYAERLAIEKVRAGWACAQWRQLDSRPTLAADTTLSLDDEIIGKPCSLQEASDILSRLSGRSHQVITAVALKTETGLNSCVQSSTVWFRTLSPQEIGKYLAYGESMDKAGAYAVQGLSALFIERIEGSYSGIMGLPLFETGQLLQNISLSLLK